MLPNHLDKKTIQNKAQAHAFINQLNLSTEEINALNQSYDLPSTGDPMATLQSALVSGEVAVTIQPDAKKPQKVTEYIEDVINAAEPEPASEPTSTDSEPTSTDSESTSTTSENNQNETESETTERDDKSTADVMKEAAAEGTPFCEECEKDEAKTAA